MTRRQVLLAGMVGIIFLTFGLVIEPPSEQAGLDAMTSLEQTNVETDDLWAQISVFFGGIVLFCLVLLPVAVTIFYPNSRDQRRRMFPQLPDEPLFEALLIKDWNKKG